MRTVGIGNGANQVDGIQHAGKLLFRQQAWRTTTENGRLLCVGVALDELFVEGSRHCNVGTAQILCHRHRQHNLFGHEHGNVVCAQLVFGHFVVEDGPAMADNNQQVVGNIGLAQQRRGGDIVDDDHPPPGYLVQQLYVGVRLIGLC